MMLIVDAYNNGKLAVHADYSANLTSALQRPTCTRTDRGLAAQSWGQIHQLNLTAGGRDICQPRSKRRRRSSACTAETRGHLQTPTSSDDLQPVAQHSTAFAPATVANLGPGFDWLGCAVDVSLLSLLSIFPCISWCLNPSLSQSKIQRSLTEFSIDSFSESQTLQTFLLAPNMK